MPSLTAVRKPGALMSNRSAVVTMILVLSCGLSLAQSAGAQTVPTSPQPDAERARVFITDSESWEMSGASGGSSGGFAGETHGGARPQTAEIVKTFGERCPSVVTNNIQSK